MNIGNIRPARAGEVPTHVATETVRAGQPAVVTARLHPHQERIIDALRERRVEIVVHGRAVRSLRPHDDFLDAALYSMLPLERAARERRRREKRNERIWLIVVLAIGIPFVLFAAYRLHQSVMAFIS